MPRGRGVLLALLLAAPIAAALVPQLPACPGAAPLAPPGPRHPLGGDPLGRDAACILVLGALRSLAVAAAALGSSLAVLASAAALAATGRERLVAYLAGVLAGLPRFPLLGLLALYSRPGPLLLGLLAGLLASPGAARSVASAAAREARSPYVEAALAAGATGRWVVARHVLPALGGQLAAHAGITAAAAVYMEAGLAMIGLLDPSRPSLGAALMLLLETPGALLTLAGLLQAATALMTIAGIGAAVYASLRPSGRPAEKHLLAWLLA